jgi:hypothetical protein
VDLVNECVVMTVLPTIKSEMNVLRSRYASAMKNHVTQGM